MRKIVHVFGTFLWIVSGILMFIFWFAAMNKWLGFFGSLIAVVVAPGLVVFPIVFWIVEGIFPLNYFIIWGVGVIGLIIAGVSSED